MAKFYKIILIIDIIIKFAIITFQGLVARQPYLCKKYSLFSVLLSNNEHESACRVWILLFCVLDIFFWLCVAY